MKMWLIWASSLFIAFSPLCRAVDVRPSPAENEAPQVVGSEVKALPPVPGGNEGQASAPPAPIFSEGAPEASGAPIRLSSEASIQPGLGAEENQQNASLAPAEVSSLAPQPAEAGAGAENASQPPLASPVSPSFEFEPNGTLSNEQRSNASNPVEGPSSKLSPGEQAEQAKHPSSSLPLKSASPNVTVVDLGAANKSDGGLISEILSNNTRGAESAQNASSPVKFLLPSKIEKLRLTVIGFTGKPVHSFNLTEHQVLYQMKVFWGEPDSWQDIGWRASDRLYELFCWLTVNGGFARDLFRGNLSGSLDQHSQWYAFPEAEDNQTYGIAVNCGIRPVSAASKSGDWSFSDPANVRDAPVFLRGFENVNVRGWTKEEVFRLIKNQKRHDAPVAKSSQAKTKAKNRRAS